MSQSPTKIAVVLPHWIGDAVMATPTLRALRTHFPKAHLVALGREAVCAVLESTPYVDEFFPIPHRPGLAELWRFAQNERVKRPDYVILLPHSFRWALFGRWTSAKAIVGAATNGRGFLLTHAVPPWNPRGTPTPRYTGDEFLSVVRAIGAVDDGKGLELPYDAERASEIRTRYAPNGETLVLLVPGAAFGPSKRWPAERFAAVADALCETHKAVCIMHTGPGEEEVRTAVRQHARHPVRDAGEDLGGVANLRATVAASDVVVCNDTGPRHIAVAYQKPVVCIMGPTHPGYTRSPWEKGRVLRVDVDCGPCRQPICRTDHRCMKGVTVEVVLAALEPYLHEAPANTKGLGRAPMH